MQPINTNELRASKKVKTIIDDQQYRIWQLERALDDLNRAAEIAQYSGQYEVIDVYRAEAESLLQDRLVVPDVDTTMDASKIRIITGEVSSETKKAIKEKLNSDD